ncbi:MAG: hypothetical protein FJ317_05540 [SAR202 cluster bacterium]|nr:hypothetical protein [SAR202 cluster bacterium]
MYRLSQKEKKYLEFQRVGRMGLVGEDGLPHVTPLCHTLSKGVLYIQTKGSSWKVRSLQHLAEVVYVVDEYSEDWDALRGVKVHGRVEVLKDGDEYATAKRLLFKKYPQFKTLGWQDGRDVVMKIVPIKTTNWGL